MSFTAIQCKFFGREQYIPKGQVDSFANASDRTCFTRRIFVYTGRLSEHAEQELVKDRSVPITPICYAQLAAANLNWERYLQTGQLVVTHRVLRPYQQLALENVIEGFKHHNRGKLIMACGTGKTFTSLKIAERQTGNKGFILFLVPSLALLSQTLLDWKRQASVPLTAFAVCSDSKVGKSGDENDFASFLRPSELSFPATTDAKGLAAAVLKANLSNEGMMVIFSTYHSLDVIHQAQTDFNLPAFDLIICDEAHRTAGAYLFSDLNAVKAAQAQFERSATAMTAPLDSAIGATVTTAVPDAPPSESQPETKARKPRRMRGAASEVDDESLFTRIHNDGYIKGLKRLYMTATPKVYGGDAKQQENKGEAVLYSMDDEKFFGPVFHALNFAQAVDERCLVDYKVIILATDKKQLPADTDLNNFSQFHAAKVVGTWKALNKYSFNLSYDDAQPMRRAVGFAQVIDAKSKYDKVGSKQFTENFQRVIEDYRAHLATMRDAKGRATEELAFVNEHNLACDCRHIDGSMNAVQKGALLDWLRAEPEEDHCKILFNVRCLSEGVDVPSLDAVIFLSPRKSPVEVVQTVGRVMRTAPGKKCGYVIIPIITDNLDEPESVLDQSADFKVIWQVLNALKSINPDQVLVDGRTGALDGRIEVICNYQDPIKAQQTGEPRERQQGGSTDPEPRQGSFDLDQDIVTVEDAIKSLIIKKIGNRKEWQDWAEDVAGICTDQIQAIKRVLADSRTPELKDKFKQFCDDLCKSMSQHFTAEQIIEMLAQQVVIKPVLDHLFPHYDFTKHNPIAHALTHMVEELDAQGLTNANEKLAAFYQSVGKRMQNVKSVQARQKVIVDLFDRFFKVAFPKLQEKLGIVYTPVEVVDFINHSVNDILHQEFGLHLGSPNVHILEPFAGTGTFLTRMMQSPELISLQELPHKYHRQQDATGKVRSELHGFEILPLAYYVASINIEAVYHELMHLDPERYEPNKIMVLTDTFAEQQVDARLLDESLDDNNELSKAVRALPFKVIISNPPYSVGQNSANDDNQNESYPALEHSIEDTYAARSGDIKNKNSLYDSYIKAFRWASDHLGESGVIAFVTNAGWVEAAAACGIRRSFQQEFSAVYVYHLKGNQRTSGEQSRKEGGKIFGAGSRAPIAITILVKNPRAAEQGKIYFATVADYLSREDKLAQLKTLRSIRQAPLVELHPDAHGDWLNQRRDDFGHFITVDGKKTSGFAIFANYSRGIATARDAWSYNSSKDAIAQNFTDCIACYNAQVEALKRDPDGFVRDNDETKIKWNGSLDSLLRKGQTLAQFDCGLVVSSLYRPFCKQFLYNDKAWIERTYQMPQLFPFSGAKNLVISVASVGASSFSCLMSSEIVDLHLLESAAQCFPRYLYRKDGVVTQKPQAGGLLDVLEASSAAGAAQGVVENGYERVDAIRPEAVAYFKAAYPEEAAAIDADAVFYYIYGILHSPEYRATYANNLQKELPRIPRVASYADFKAFSEAGRALAQLHVDYEKVPLSKECTLNYAEGRSAHNMSYHVKQLKYGKIKGKTGNAAKDKSVIIYNADLTISNIPLEVQEYVVNKKSALDWVVERCGISSDKASRIVNDYNDYADAVGDERYILNLILRVITVSLETMKIVKALPRLTIHKLDQ